MTLLYFGDLIRDAEHVSLTLLGGGNLFLSFSSFFFDETSFLNTAGDILHSTIYYELREIGQLTIGLTFFDDASCN